MRARVGVHEILKSPRLRKPDPNPPELRSVGQLAPTQAAQRSVHVVVRALFFAHRDEEDIGRSAVARKLPSDVADPRVPRPISSPAAAREDHDASPRDDVTRTAPEHRAVRRLGVDRRAALLEDLGQPMRDDTPVPAAAPLPKAARGRDLERQHVLLERRDKVPDVVQHEETDVEPRKRCANEKRRQQRRMVAVHDGRR